MVLKNGSVSNRINGSRKCHLSVCNPGVTFHEYTEYSALIPWLHRSSDLTICNGNLVKECNADIMSLKQPKINKARIYIPPLDVI